MNRWLTARHEGGHLVADWAQGGIPERGYLCADGGGLAFSHGLHGAARAIALAAGEAAERVLADEPEPEAPQFEPVLESRESLTANVPRVFDDWVVPPIAETDAFRIAMWCVSGCESEPERWVDRYHTVITAAERIIKQHREQVLAVAREIFSHGQILPPKLSRILPPRQEAEPIS